LALEYRKRETMLFAKH